MNTSGLLHQSQVQHLGLTLLWFATSWTWILFSCFTRCWDIIENTDVFWWIIKTPILASILVSLLALSFISSLKFHYIYIYSLWAVDTLKSEFYKEKVIATERERVSYHQSTSDLWGLCQCSSCEFFWTLFSIPTVCQHNREAGTTSKFSFHFGKFSGISPLVSAFYLCTD